MSEPAVDAAEVRHVAGLARVELSDEEVEAFASQFVEILEHFEALESVPDTEAEPELVNVLRPDEVRPSLDQSAALANTPENEDGKFKGPRVS